MSAIPSAILIFFAFFAGVVVLIFGIWALFKVFGLLGRFASHLGRFVIGMFSDFFRAIGAIVLLFVLAPITVLNVAIGRWSAAAHYGRAFKNEVRTAGVCFYRVLAGHPLRFLGLGGVVEGIEERLPQVIAEAPGSDKPSKRAGMFDGYTIVGSLAGGGSGGKLFIATPNEIKRASFQRQGFGEVDQVVIKSFSLDDGSSLPQIVRESRALDAAKKLGLVFEHDLSNDRFFYVMRYVPGESLATLTTRMHGLSSAQGLSDAHLRTSLGYMTDLLKSLAAYHAGGLWHKDVKPDNIIVDGKKAHLVDFGLVTPLRSAMTLTTHGTEYFRDPELVRQALRGVKVHQIDGTKFDVYAAGAVLFAIIENSFPAHGGLSQITKRCPEAVRWIVRRAMADYDKRYASASEMLADVSAVLSASDAFSLRPADLPSMSGQNIELPPQPEPMPAAFVAQAGSIGGAGAVAGERAAAQAQPTPQRLVGRPALAVSNWWSGRYDLKGHAGTRHGIDAEAGESLRGQAVSFGRSRGDDGADAAFAAIPAGVYLGKHAFAARSPKPAKPDRKPLRDVAERASAADQLRSARARAAARRRTAQQRVGSRRATVTGNPSGINAGVVGAVMMLFLGAAVLLGGALVVPGLFAYNRAQGEYSEAWDKAQRAIADATRVDGPNITVQGPLGTLPPTPAAPTVPVAAIAGPSLEHERILIVSDLASPLSPELSEQLFQMSTNLAARGATLVGDGPILMRTTESVDESNVELLAAIKAVRGQMPADDPWLMQIVQTFLQENPTITRVMWLAPVEGEGAGVHAQVFTPESRLSSMLRKDVGQNLIALVNGQSVSRNSKP